MSDERPYYQVRIFFESTICFALIFQKCSELKVMRYDRKRKISKKYPMMMNRVSYDIFPTEILCSLNVSFMSFQISNFDIRKDPNCCWRLLQGQNTRLMEKMMYSLCFASNERRSSIHFDCKYEKAHVMSLLSPNCDDARLWNLVRRHSGAVKTVQICRLNCSSRLCPLCIFQCHSAFHRPYFQLCRARALFSINSN